MREEDPLRYHPRLRPPGRRDPALIDAGRTTLVSTCTGSGKYPASRLASDLRNKCLELKDTEVNQGISAVEYPMNALAEDQLGRLRSLLAGTGVSFGMYVRKTPEQETQVTGIRTRRPDSSRANDQARLAQVPGPNRSDTVHPPEEVRSREVMRMPARQLPRLGLTNVKQLELLQSRQRYTELFADARLDFLGDSTQAHTFTRCAGRGSRVPHPPPAYRSRNGYVGDTVCVATSATIVDTDNPDAARDFASRFFGVAWETVATVGEAYESEVWAD